MAPLNYLADLLRRNYIIFTILLVTSFAFAGVYYDKINVDNIQIDANEISSTNSNGDIELNPNGTGGVLFTDLTATTVPYLDANKELTSSAVTPTELGYLSGVTSALQTQLDAKLDDTNSTTDNEVLRTNGTSGDALQSSGMTIDDNGIAEGLEGLHVGVGGENETITIGGSAITSTLGIHAEGGTDLAELSVHRHSDTAGFGSHFVGVRSRGTEASESAVQSGDYLLRLDGLGFDGTDYEIGAQIDFIVDGTPGSNDMPGRISFLTTPDGSATSVEAVRIDSSQNLNVMSQKELRLQDSTGGEYMGFKAPSSVTSSTSFTLPDGDGTNGQVLSTNGSGTLAWADSSSGVGGGFNLENDPYAQTTEDGATNWILFDDGATTCGDLTGGTVTSTFANSASETQILSGDYVGTFVLTHGASNLSGEGIAKAYTIPQSLKDKGYITITVRYSADVALATGDYKICAYDATNGAEVKLYGLSNQELPAIGVDKAGYISVKGYLPNDISSLRIGFLRATTDATATNFHFSDLRVTDDHIVDAPIVGQPIDFTPSWSNFTVGNGTYDYAYYKRVGNKMVGSVKFTFGSTSAMGSVPTMTIPGGYSVDTNYKDSSDGYIKVARGNILDSGTATYISNGILASNTTVILKYEDGSGIVQNLSSSAPMTWATNDSFQFDFEFEINGWDNESGVLSNAEMKNRNADVQGAGTGGESISSSVDIDFTEVSDDLGAWDGDQFTAPYSGKFVFSGSVALTAGTSIALYSYRDAVQSEICGYAGGDAVATHTFNCTLYLDKNEVWSLRSDTAATTSNVTTRHWIDIQGVPDLSVYASYYEPLKTQIKYLTADVTTNTTMSDLTFSNLEVGQWYRIEGSFNYRAGTTAQDNIIITVTHNSGTIGRSVGNVNTSGDEETDHITIEFQAEASSLTFVTTSVGASNLIAGNGAKSETWVRLSEIHHKQVTSEW